MRFCQICFWSYRNEAVLQGGLTWLGDFDKCLSLHDMHHCLFFLTFQGGLTWLGDFDECLSLTDMHHCLLPWNSSFAHGTQLAPLYTISMIPPSLGVCFPSNCSGVDASGRTLFTWLGATFQTIFRSLLPFKLHRRGCFR